MLEKTGNIYIEYLERLRRNNSWVKSGILKEDNTKYWIIGSEKEYYIFKKVVLCNLYNNLKDNPNGCVGCKFVEEKENGTSKGFLVRRDVAKKYCYANSIEDFIKIMQKKYYAHGYYYHGKRDCKYIVNKNEDSLKVFKDEQEAQNAGYTRCTSKDCFE